MAKGFQKGHIPVNPIRKGEHRGRSTEFKKGHISLNKKDKIRKVCSCGKEILTYPCLKETRKFCSRKCSDLSRKGMTPWNKDMKMSEEHCEKLSQAHKGIKCPWNIIRLKGKFGAEALNYRGGVSSVKRENKRNDSAYQAWVKEIRRRDGKCRLLNENCRGYLTVHHILTWAEYPEERYNVNNGITLCQGHHPRKRADEKRLVPVFQELVINTQ